MTQVLRDMCCSRHPQLRIGAEGDELLLNRIVERICVGVDWGFQTEGVS